MLAVFHRTSLGVAGLLAVHRFHIDSAQLATFTMVQLAVYAAMQVPVGTLLDRFGSKAMLLAGVSLMTLAQAVFAFADTFALGIVARVFVGMGDAMTFVSVLRLVALWFPPARSPMLSQATGLLGQLGAIGAAGPLALLLRGVGWTWSFLLTALVGVVFASVVLRVVIDSPYPSRERERVELRALAGTLRDAWRASGTRLGLWSHFATQFSSNAFTLLWGYPFLVAGEGLSPATASLVLVAMIGTAVLTAPVVGLYVARWPYSRSTLVLAIVAAIASMWTVLLGWPGHAPLALILATVMVTAVGGPGSMVGFDLARSFNPPRRLGSATGIVNAGGFTASLAAVLLIGLVLDRVAAGGPQTYTMGSFRVAMAVQYPIWALGVVQILRYRSRARAEVRLAASTFPRTHNLRR